MSTTRRYSRRTFLTTAPAAIAGAVAFPSIVKASALGLNGAVPPSDRVVMAGIGFGMQGPGNMRNFLGKPEVQWVAVCDLDDERAEEGEGHRRHEVRDDRLQAPTRTTGSCSPAATSMPCRSRCPTTGTPSCRSTPCGRAWTSTARNPSRTACARGARCATPCSGTAASGRPAAGSGRKTTSTAPASWSPTAASARSCASRSACRQATRTSPGPSARRRSKARRPASTTTDGWARRRIRRTARRACT